MLPMDSARQIVVTGSTRGIGKGLAGELLRRGHNVAISGRTRAAADAAVAELQPLASGGARAVGFACDVSRADELQRLWDEAVREFGRVDIWVNNAGLSHPRQRGGEMRAEDIRSVEETNLLGMMLATRVALLGMQGQPGGGVIYNMEGFGSNGMMTPGMSLYGASKFALTYFNKALLAETRDGPVKVCYLSPGIVLTDLLKRDMGSNDPQDWERTKRVYNILADRVETVTPFLAEGILRNDKAGARVAWLTGGKAARRFFMSLFRKRQLITDADLAP
jgi:NAD(P)-dependent dehydrogenase (short-subunit alcohol dehydrogenase family)